MQREVSNIVIIRLENVVKKSNMSAQFVDGWTIGQVLGEGAFGEVKLLINDDTNDALALKIINTELHEDAKLAVRKEIAIHRALSHPNIIRYFGHRSDKTVEYIFLEYASGGELFNKIEPDVGMESWEAQKYFVQLVSGVEYLHMKGVSHRDIKPENILLDDHDNVKLSDFGMATLFRKNGVERLLDKKCGTIPYIAPEVLLRPYKAMPADIWSCGIVLVAMLAGELPWDVPSASCKEFEWWKNNVITHSPWNKLDNTVLNLLKKILVPLSDKRLTATQILKHRWCSKNYSSEADSEGQTTVASKRLYSDDKLSSEVATSEEEFSRLCYSQPPLDVSSHQAKERENADAEYFHSNRIHCFSQPDHIDDLLLNSQLHCTQQATQNSYQKLVRRMTRFLVTVDAETAISKVSDTLKNLGCTWKRGPPFVLTFTTIDPRKNHLIFKANVVDMNDKVLVDFRLSRGCGLEFKKLFLKTKEKLRHLIMKANMPWTVQSVAMSTPV